MYSTDSMTPRLYRILLELDRRDYTSEDFFKWNDNKKQELIDDLVSLFDPVLDMTESHKASLLWGLIRAIEESEYLEDYENAEILTRLYEVLSQKYFK